ncbi:MAG TPA: hypothetical protein VHD86_16455 [Xanthobacteraceae bacterium]|nr:hypothetical protein [Xanthobacteraceae bacterium]
MSRAFDFSRLLAGYSSAAALPKRVSPGVVIAAVDVFAVLVGFAAMHVGGLVWSGGHPPAAPSLIAPVSADDQVATAVPDPHLRPIVAAIRLPAAPDAAVVFSAPVVTDRTFAGATAFAPASSTSTAPAQVASTPDEPAAVVDPDQPSPPVAKLADIAISGHLAQRSLAVSASVDTRLDDLLLSRGAANASGAGVAVAINAGTGVTQPANVGATVATSANVEIASAAPVVRSAATTVGATVGNTVGGVTGAVRGLLN